MSPSRRAAVQRWLVPAGISLTFLGLLSLPRGGAAPPPLVAAGAVFRADGPLSCLAWSPDGQLLVAASYRFPGSRITAEGAGAKGSEVALWEVGEGALRRLPLRQRGMVGSAALTPGGGVLLASRAETRHWDLRTGRLWNRFRHDTATSAPVALSGEGRWLATTTGAGVSLWSMESGERRWQSEALGSPVSAVSIAPDGSRLAMVYPGSAVLLDGGSGALRARLPLPDPACTAFSPDGQRLAVGCANGELALWDLDVGRCRWRIPAEQGSVRALAFSPDGRLLATSTADASSEQGAAALWKVETGQPAGTVLGHRGPIMALAFSPDGRTLATGGLDATVRLWTLPR